jgi:hypothetical protein
MHRRRAVASPARASSIALRVRASPSPSSNTCMACVVLWRLPLGRPGLPGANGRPRVVGALLRGGSIMSVSHQSGTGPLADLRGVPSYQLAPEHDLGRVRECIRAFDGASQLIRERLADLYLAWSTDIAAVIAEAQADGSISTKTPAADLAAFLLDAYEGALLRARVEKSGRAFDRFMKVTFTQILV